jgi:penicillin-binding protein 1C
MGSKTNRRRRWWGLTALVAVGAGVAFWAMLPTPLFRAPAAYVAVDRHGELLGARIASDGQWRFPPRADVADKFAQAIVAYEDQRFWSHPGVDPLAIARALKQNAQSDRIVSGGSTITMQVARLARERTGRSLGAKFVEALWALRLELSFDKAEILALYTNHAPFGGNVVGLEAAAWRYFGRAPDTLSWAEACTLAVLPNSPALVNLARNRDALLRKRDFVLRRLHSRGVIDALELELALAEPLTAEPRELPSLAPHLLESLRAAHPEQHRFVTTLDTELQAAATALVHEHGVALARHDIHNAAAIILDNRSFEVLAYVGNTAWQAGGERGFAVDIVRRPRSTGSILKPVLYAAMLEEGSLLPQMLLADVPTQYAGYSPENFDRQYRGAVAADAALAQSLNVPAVRMLRRYGVERFYDVLRSMGMSTLNQPPDHYGLTLVLGGAEGTLWDMAQLHANLADLAGRSATAGPPTLRRAQVLVDEASAESASTVPVNHAIGAGAAWLTLNALLEVQRPGEEGHWRNFASAHKIAWKTGTSWGLRDGWAIGSTSRHTIAVWVGNASGEGRPGLTGSAVAAPLLFALFNRVGGSDWFEPPYYALKQVDVCRNDGYLANDYCDANRIWIPRDSHFDQQTPHNVLVHLDAHGAARVDSSCSPIGEMRPARWFVLPPTQEFYFRRQHASYQALPAYRDGCTGAAPSRAPLDFIYPTYEARIYVPLELDGRASRVVFQAVHRERGAEILWHLDDNFLGVTRGTHSQALDLAPGPHVLTIVDRAGNRASRRFEILERVDRHAGAAATAVGR